MESPLLGIQLDTEQVDLLRVTYSDPLPAPVVTVEDGVKVYTNPMVLEGAAAPSRLQVTPTKVIPQISVSSLEEAEDLFVDFCNQKDSYSVFNPDQVSSINTDTPKADIYAALIILILRGANLIAARTRRGAGNVVLVNPEDLHYFKEASLSAFSSMNTGFGETLETIGRWDFVGTINNTLKVYTGPVQKGRVVVLYKGAPLGDTPAVYSEHEGQGWLTWMQNSTESLGNADDYVHIVTIKDEANGN